MHDLGTRMLLLMEQLAERGFEPTAHPSHPAQGRRRVCQATTGASFGFCARAVAAHGRTTGGSCAVSKAALSRAFGMPKKFFTPLFHGGMRVRGHRPAEFVGFHPTPNPSFLPP